jgi:integrase
MIALANPGVAAISLPPMFRPRTRRALVSVRQERVRGQKRWVVAWTEGERLRRQFYRSRIEAEEAAELRRGDNGAVLAQIEAHGLTLRKVWEAYLTATKPVEVAKGPTLAETIEEVLRAKAAGGRSTRYLSALEQALQQFAEGRPATRIGAISTRDVEDWLGSKRLASRSTLRSRLSALFSFAVRRGYCAENPCDRLEAVRSERPVPAVFTPRQAAKALVWLRSRMPRALGAFVLSTLCGLRPEEAQATTWEAIRLDAPGGAHVVVEAQTSKVRQRRVVYPLPMAVAWLRVAREHGSDLPLPRMAWRRMLHHLRGVLGWKVWPKDVTRHTAATYWLATEPNAHKVAEQLGNSPGILKTHYWALVTREEADRFWKLVPRSERAVAASSHPQKLTPTIEP